jgi:hypothetical protein
VCHLLSLFVQYKWLELQCVVRVVCPQTCSIRPYPVLPVTCVTAGRTMPMIDRSYIYVVIDTAKNNFRKTEYKVTNSVSGDSWVKLKRGE